MKEDKPELKSKINLVRTHMHERKGLVIFSYSNYVLFSYHHQSSLPSSRKKQKEKKKTNNNSTKFHRLPLSISLLSPRPQPKKQLTKTQPLKLPSTPVHSIAFSTPPSSPAASLILSPSSSSPSPILTRTVRTVGTRVFAKARREGERSVRIMGVAPAAKEERRVRRPMGPAPLAGGGGREEREEEWAISAKREKGKERRKKVSN